MSDDIISLGDMQFTPQNQAVVFYVQNAVGTLAVNNVWALRIDKNGITSNPDVPVDDGAKAIFEALKPYLLSLNK